ncbi:MULTISPECIES: S8 family peptidase [Nocardioides]|uniref:S8 family serine peptidase n=1 Tax=Nocardioides vastitatis TaxID=2568655 RepID=A0ABW0ZI23_9ACTN|nr:S8/S53 family peptidase [Nocardioides sp.]THJ16111.1 hypothetical protein E7Z54_00130 [Nocardioides sp.]
MNDPVRPDSPLGTLRDLLRRLLLPLRGGGRRPASEPDRKPTPEEVDAERLRVQVQVIRRAFEEIGGVAVAGVKGSQRPTDDSEVDYLYRPKHALVREADLDRLTRFFAERGQSFRGGVDRVGQPAQGLALVALPSRSDGQDDVLATLEEIDRELGAGMVTPDHVVYVTPKGFMCPATEPEVPKRKTPFPGASEAAGTSAGDGVRVAVVDTGLWTPAVSSATTPWMSGVLADPEDVETINPSSIHPYGGHGTFVAGVVRCLAPATRVEVEGVLTRGGAVYESEICRQLDQALSESDHPQLISISAGTHTRRDFAMLSFEMLAATYGLDDGEETLIVAAAGNDGSDRPFWPAAFPWVVSVGSVDPDGTVSDFSNHGSWVDVYARGRDIVNAFPEGSYTCYEPPNVGEVRSFTGLAQWSGTSFATPVVTGLIAARMSAADETAGQAWASVLGSGTSSTPTSGGPITIVGPLS